MSPRLHLAMSGDIFIVAVCGVLQDIQQCTGELPTTTKKSEGLCFDLGLGMNFLTSPQMNELDYTPKLRISLV